MKAATQLVCREWVNRYGRNKLQSLLDACACALNISLGLITPYGESITIWSNSPISCEMVRARNAESCERERQSVLKYVCEAQKPVKYECYMGVTTFACPVVYRGELVALCLGGGVADAESTDPNIPQEIHRLSGERIDEIMNMMGCMMSLLSCAGDTAEQDEDPQESGSVDALLLKNKLSVREIEVVRLVNLGRSNKEISSQLNISEKTVKTHITNILRKLKLKDRLELILYCKNICVS